MRIERVPVSPAELLQGRRSVWRTAILRGQDDAPAGRRKTPRTERNKSVGITRIHDAQVTENPPLISSSFMKIGAVFVRRDVGGFPAAAATAIEPGNLQSWGKWKLQGANRGAASVGECGCQQSADDKPGAADREAAN